MPSPIFCWIDDQPISVDQVLGYLKTSGRLQPFLQEILHQHAIALRLQELQSNSSFNVTPEVVEQILNAFRQRKQLQEDEAFLTWLRERGINDNALRQQLAEQWILQQLKESSISNSMLEDFFTANAFNLDRLTLSWIGVQNKELAEELFDQITEEGGTFDQLAREHILSDSQSDVGWMRSFRRGELSEELKSVLKEKNSESLIKPVEVNNHWYVFRIDNLRKASFNSLKEQLRTEQFEQQLAKQAEAMSVKLEVMRWFHLQTSTH